MAEKLSVLSRLGYAFNRCNFLSFCLKSLQVKCFVYLLKDNDIVVVLHTGFGKSDARVFSRPSHLQGKSPGNEVGRFHHQTGVLSIYHQIALACKQGFRILIAGVRFDTTH